MKKLVVANWKSNPQTFSEALKLAKASDFKDVVVAPPYIYLQTLSWTLKKATVCAQDTFWEASGPYTGEITPSQLKNLKVRYVIVGHSERRNLGETDLMINAKIKAAMKAGLEVILCIGEDWSVRRKGIAAAKRYIADQLKKDLKGVRSSLILAYEPVWAIGTGKSDKPKTSAEIIKHIKNILDTKILYGGSITPKNAKSFLSQTSIDGALVGGASLSPQSFRSIVKIRNSI
ncbi:MAG: triose-phosphate isomerase [Candidatus Colwellbacteria bacterium]